MLKSVVVILIGIIVFLVGLVISMTQTFSTDAYWIGVGLIVSGIAIIIISIIGKLKKWF